MDRIKKVMHVRGASCLTLCGHYLIGFIGQKFINGGYTHISDGGPEYKCQVDPDGRVKVLSHD